MKKPNGKFLQILGLLGEDDVERSKRFIPQRQFAPGERKLGVLPQELQRLWRMAEEQKSELLESLLRAAISIEFGYVKNHFEQFHINVGFVVSISGEVTDDDLGDYLRLPEGCLRSGPALKDLGDFVRIPDLSSAEDG